MSTAGEKLLSFTGPASFGGPSSYNVIFDSGAPGQRGTYFLLSDKDPNEPDVNITYSYTDSANPLFPILANYQLNDVCINLNPFDTGYLNFYQYREPRPQTSETETKWYKEFALTPTSIPYISGRAPDGSLDVIFSNGVAVVPLPPIPIPDILWPTILAAHLSSDPQDMVNLKLNLLSNVINIQYNIIGDNPISSNIAPYPSLPSLDSITFDFENQTGTLGLAISGLEYSSNSWSALNGEKVVHLIISFDYVV